jgi:hypothetical protein
LYPGVFVNGFRAAAVAAVLRANKLHPSSPKSPNGSAPREANDTTRKQAISSAFDQPKHSTNLFHDSSFRRANFFGEHVMLSELLPHPAAGSWTRHSIPPHINQAATREQGSGPTVAERSIKYMSLVSVDSPPANSALAIITTATLALRGGWPRL